MKVHIGHVLFPCETSLSLNDDHDDDDDDDDGESSAKRFKHEGSTQGEKRSFDVTPKWLSAALHEALLLQHGAGHGSPAVEVNIDEAGRGASFCFAPGILAESLRTPTHAALELPRGVSIAAVEATAPPPLRFTELTVISPNGEVWQRLPLYWEERLVKVSSTGTTQATATGADQRPSHGKTDAAVAEETLLAKRLLVVGAGGIGCELLKVLVLYGFCHIDVIDLDTIDATNLNRQFLFQKEDVGASKAEMARKSILSWFTPTSSRRAPMIHAHHANIKDDAYDDAFFRQFSIVLNALDNVSARQHVNRMCMRVGVPLIESGTMGYNGQVQPIVRSLYECYDCRPKAATQPTVAVCTIHARPTTMVHCVHYAKELYERLFGDEPLEGRDELSFVAMVLATAADQQDQHRSDDICGLRRTAVALARCLFHERIHALLDMKSVWTIQPPVPLSEEELNRLSEQMVTASAFATANRATDAKGSDSVNVPRESIMSVNETLMLFVDAFVRCTRRGARASFRKEDDNAVDFVAAVANLRAAVFHIVPPRSVEDIRSIAGSIVPAIATTNAIVAAAVVQQALCVLNMESATCPFTTPQTVYVRRAPQVRRRRLPMCASCNTLGGAQRWVNDLYVVHSAPPSSPSGACIVCRDCRPTVRVYVDATCTTLIWFVHHVLRDRLSMAAPSIFCGASVLYEEGEYEAMAETPLVQLMGGAGVKPLELLIDDLDHEVEWRLVVEHCTERRNGEVVVIEGLEAALQLEAALISDATAATTANATAAREDGGDDDNNADNNATTSVEMVTDAVGSGGGSPVAVVVEDEENSDSCAVSVVDID